MKKTGNKNQDKNQDIVSEFRSQAGRKTRIGTKSTTALDDLYQVILYNDDHNTAQYVVLVLMEIFGHSAAMAAKLMREAHNTGRTIAQVEGKTDAIKHLRHLNSAGLMATVSKI